MPIERFGLDDEVARLEAEQASGEGLSLIRVMAALAWHLRQRDMQRALALADDVERRLDTHAVPQDERHALSARLMLVRGESRWLLADLHGAELLADGACGLFAAVGDDTGLSDAHWLISNVMNDLGDAARRDAAFQHARAHAARTGDQTRIDFADAVGYCVACFSDPVEARRHDAAIDEWIRSGPPTVKVPAHYFRFFAAFRAGEYAKAIEHGLRAKEMALAGGQVRRAISLLSNVGITLTDLNDLEGALEYSRECLEMARRSGWPLIVAECLTQTADVLRRLDRPDAAHELATEALGVMQGMERSTQYAVALNALGRVQAAQGRFLEAEASFVRMHEIATAQASTGLAVYATRGRADALAKAGLRKRAIEAAQALEQLADSDNSGRIESLLLIARLHANDPPLPSDVHCRNSLSLRYLEQALAIARGIEGMIAPADLLEELAGECSRLGDPERAYRTMLLARDAREKIRSKEASNRAVAMEVRHRTAQARAQAEHHRQLAASEAQRAAELEQANATLQSMGTIGREITAQLDSAQVFESLDRRIKELMDVRDVRVYLLDADGDCLDLAFASPARAGTAPVALALSDSSSQVARCARERHELIADEGDAARRSTLMSPLVLGDRLLGVIAAGSPRPAAYAQRDALMLRSVCAYGAIALVNSDAYRRLDATLGALRKAQAELVGKNLELETAYRTLQDLSVTDPLTGLRNRRFLLQHIESDIALCLRQHEERLNTLHAAPPQDADICFFLIDLDHFKQVNDAHGHAAGDQVLMQMRERLQMVFRESDYLVRWGGEEFLVVARQTHRSRADAMAGRICAVVEGQPFDIGNGGRLPLTCSVGFASFPFDLENPRATSWPRVVDLADDALYMAKRGGRNGWVGMAEPGIESSLPRAAMFAAEARERAQERP
jgi:diguanylate cyclase (GGDEF)-like protein